jgi:hypothetical protein
VQIVARQLSGLGNQMFQYAAGRYYAQRYGAELVLAVDPLGAVSHGFPRPNLLSNFAITAPIRPFSRYDQLLMSPRRSLKMGVDLLRRLTGVQVYAEEFHRRYEFNPDIPVQSGVRRLYLLGYWQSFRFAGEIENAIRSELTLTEPAKGKNLEILERIKRSEHPVSIHLRRGDAILESVGRAVLTTSYYRRVIRHFQNRFSTPTFFVFSDDIDFARRNLSSDKSMVFVDHNDDFSAHEDLRLMSSCHHHIIANSTFSWWGAWLNPRPDKVVAAPKARFVAEANEFLASLPSNWVLFDHEDGSPVSAELGDKVSHEIQSHRS